MGNITKPSSESGSEATMPTFWKIAPGQGASVFDECRQDKCITINWYNHVNLAKFKPKDDLEAFTKKEEGGGVTSIWRFVKEIQVRDIVIANDGFSRVVGIGVVESEYLPPGDPRNPRTEKDYHRQARLVDWRIDQPVDSGKKPFFHVQHTVRRVTPEERAHIDAAYRKKHPELKEKLDELFDDNGGDGQDGRGDEDMRALLEQFGQIILYGPPGTGKTREAKRLALALLSGKEAAAPAAEEDIDKSLKAFREAGQYDLVVFHPAYEYEQFIGGIAPSATTGQVAFQTKPGSFLRICRAAEQHRKPAVLVIDEINRGNLPKLLGELVYALEYRDQPVELPFECDNRRDLVVPKKLYIIATMNSADRSIGHIDVAIRRRFALYHLPPSTDVVEQVWRSAGDASYGRQLARLMSQLNDQLAKAPDPSAAAELGVGHSYFLPSSGSSGRAAKEQTRRKWEYQVKPLLREFALLSGHPISTSKYLKLSDTGCLCCTHVSSIGECAAA